MFSLLFSAFLGVPAAFAAVFALVLSSVLAFDPAEVVEGVDLAFRIVSLALSIVGVTGGLRGVLLNFDIKLKGRGALTLSWAVGLLLALGGIALGWIAPPESMAADALYQWGVLVLWPLVSFLANVLRDKFLEEMAKPGTAPA
jgi:hypothetical protein